MDVAMLSFSGSGKVFRLRATLRRTAVVLAEAVRSAGCLEANTT